MGCGSSNYVVPNNETLFKDADLADTVMSTNYETFAPFDNANFFQIAVEVRGDAANALIKRFEFKEYSKLPLAALFEKDFSKPFINRIEKRVLKEVPRAKALRSYGPELMAEIQKLYENNQVKFIRTKSARADEEATTLNLMFLCGVGGKARLIMFRDNVSPYVPPPEAPAAIEAPVAAPAAKGKDKNGKAPVGPKSPTNAKAPALAKSPTSVKSPTAKKK